MTAQLAAPAGSYHPDPTLADFPSGLVAADEGHIEGARMPRGWPGGVLEFCVVLVAPLLLPGSVAHWCLENGGTMSLRVLRVAVAVLLGLSGALMYAASW